ncbi:hypothetical protein PNIG_a2773 [Pseudoalteromonas nigrifaciens]|uniref:Spore coat protein U domain-containing protein n=1 Tax=Pseudoalteromonas nigrifaciens TaxID=28109 RepID=A0AAC9XYE5_9GAMM|nr:MULTISPECIES: hypothetical protein [Pseudoalteromonas]ASM54754.1 hypothetical protein PNIG_a2773 [Pseudoalteromonas nigrifaciens]MBB1370317.1 hypothetical protein [Pseudoalteromonas sp. SR45-4]GEN41214.1 hypothetical protein PNI02_06800 [Pseudoalteromonas nigrifaciens]SUC51431.1 Uncharacterised protein [Pseudoalteromonas nigrifaciens]
MKKLIVLSAIAALTSGAALADSINLGAAVQSVCGVSNTETVKYFPALALGNSATVNFNLQCNDVDGATISLTTSEGHLQNSDNEDMGVGYTAALSAGPFAFTLTADDGANDQSASQSQAGTAALAAGGLAGTILVTVTQTPTWSGTYADTLTLGITAN